MKKYVFVSITCSLVLACSIHTQEVIEFVESDIPILPQNVYDYQELTKFPVQFAFPTIGFPNNTPFDNPTTNEGATLGRVLFYDKKLSYNNTIACASCHLQANAFSDPQQFSIGFEGKRTNRQGMALANLQFHRRFFWDHRALTLEEQVLMPIENEIEMGMKLPDLVEKIKQVEYYPALFQAAFGSSEITDKKIAKALSQFLRTMTACNSKYDEGIAKDFTNFSTLEKEGRLLFLSGRFNCNHCHTTENFFENDARNNGLETNYTDLGLGAISQQAKDMGLFATPTLRNIEVTAPYMHDGRFQTLEDVIEHYNSGIKQNPNLDDRLSTIGRVGGPPKQYNMTEYEKKALVAFLKTLTDKRLLTDERYSNPFLYLPK